MTAPSYREYTGVAAENYQQNFVPAIALPVSVDLLRTAALKEGERVLDVACGTGVIARLAAEQVGSSGSVTGVDVAADMIDVAKNVPAPAGASIEWRVGDACALDLPDDSYDVVLCQMGLMFMEDRAGALAEMHRVLAPGGRLVLNTPGAIQPAFEAMEKAIVDNINPDLGGFVRAVFSIHDPKALAGMLEDAGFADADARVAPTSLRLGPPALFLWGYINLTPMGTLVAQAPEAAKNAMEQQAVAGMQPYTDDGVLCAEQPMVLASGRK